MTKNTTRKGLAFGAGLALVASGLAGVPAQAAGVTGFIPFAPSSGPATALAVEAVAGETFKLTASPAGTVMNGNVKFLINDPDAQIKPGSNTSGAVTDTIAAGASEVAGDASASTDFVTLIGADGIAEGRYLLSVNNDMEIRVGTGGAKVTALKADSLVEAVVTDDAAGSKSLITFKSEGDIIADMDVIVASTVLTLTPGALFDSFTDNIVTGDVAHAGTTFTVTTAGVPDGVYSLFFEVDFETKTSVVSYVTGQVIEVTVASNSFTMPEGAAAGDGTLVSATDAIFIKKAGFGSPRAADNSYAVDSGLNTAGDAPVIELVNTAATATTATVTAFVDLFSDNLIGASEYASSPVAVQFVEQTDIAITTVLDAAQVGAETLSATITTSPVLNGAQLGNQELIRAVFTRQGSETKAISAAATQDVDTLEWSASVEMGTETNAITAWVNATTAVNATPNAVWAGFTEPVAHTGAGTATANGEIVSVTLATTGIVTVVTFGNHGLMNGDKVRMIISVTDTAVEVAEETVGQTVTVTGLKSFTYKVTETGTITAGTDTSPHTDTDYTVDTFTASGGDGMVDRVFAGDYSAQAALEQITANRDYKLYGTASASGTLAALATDVRFSTAATTSVQGISDIGDTATAGGDLLLKAKTASATVTVTVLDKDGAALTAGRNVAITMTNRSANVTVNGLKVAQNLVTNANGEVSLVVASSTGLNAEKVDIKAIPEGVAAAVSEIRVLWATAAIQMADLATTDSVLPATQKRTVAVGTSYSVNLSVTDQWFAVADSATYRIKVTGEGVTSQFLPLVAGKATVSIADAGVKTSFNSVLTLQKASATGVFADTLVTTTINTLTEATPGVLLDVDGSNLYGSAVADLSDAVAAKALVERDARSSSVAQPVYKNAVTINGKIIDSGSSSGQDGAVVTVSGPSNILFSNGSVDARGTLTFVAAQSGGAFTVDLYSTSAQTDTVITITAAGVSKTVKVSFVGAGIGEGTSLVVTMPAAVKPASTFQVKAKLADVYGNGVNTVAGSIKVTYSGAGIVFGTLPTETDANGELMFSVLLGSNDTGSVNVTVSYDQNADGDYVDVKDLVRAGTTAITASGVVAASSDTKVNVGTFSGKLVVYALNAAGSEVSYKIAGKWVTQVVTSDLLQRYDRVVGATGKTIKVDIYVDGVLKLAKSVVTK